MAEKTEKRHDGWTKRKLLIRIGQVGGAPAVVGILLLAVPAGTALTEEGARYCDDLPYVENVYLTTDYGPAQADIVAGRESMLECTRGEYALCYYSGEEPMPCILGDDGKMAECKCQVFEASPKHPMYVGINAILNTCVYIETITQCGQDGEGCPSQGQPSGAVIARPRPAVCEYIARGTFRKDADYISAFSLQTVTAPNGEVMKLGCHDCGQTPYAGCMTASCYGLIEKDGRKYTTCQCPVYDGPFQYGRAQGTCCNPGSGQVWSAAYSPIGCAGSP